MISRPGFLDGFRPTATPTKPTRVRVIAIWRGGATACDVDVGKVLVAGRGRDADIRLDNLTVSRRHLRVVAGDGLLLLEDLGALNGTRVAGKRLVPGVAAAIPFGTPFDLGTVRVVVQVPSSCAARHDQTLASEAGELDEDGVDGRTRCGVEEPE